MIAPLDDVISRALTLSLADRAQLVQRLIPTLEDNAEEVESAWRDEISRRVAEVKNGTAKLIPGDQVMRDLRAELKGISRTR